MKVKQFRKLVVLITRHCDCASHMIGDTSRQVIMIAIAISGHSAWSQITRTHALIFAFIPFWFLVTIAFKESEQVAGIVEEFWIVLKSAREASSHDS